MLDWMGLLVVLGAVTLILAVYMLITRSAGIYATPRHFWKSALLSAGLAYLLSGGLYLLLHLNATVAVAISAIVPFLVGNLDLGEKASPEPAPTDEGLEEDQTPAGDEEAETLDDEEEAKTLDDEYVEVIVSNPGESEPFWN
ncbi:MAG TPA: hypothetical protein VFU69_02900 [Ktedonobacterales bacterium]|nr:hypothetical protein [Ktedonobacterales bacterium]